VLTAFNLFKHIYLTMSERQNATLDEEIKKTEILRSSI